MEERAGKTSYRIMEIRYSKKIIELVYYTVRISLMEGTFHCCDVIKITLPTE